MWDVECWMSDAGNLMSDVECRMLNEGNNVIVCKTLKLETKNFSTLKLFNQKTHALPNYKK